MQAHLWKYHPDQLENITWMEREKRNFFCFPKIRILIFWGMLFMLVFFPGQIFSNTNLGNQKSYQQEQRIAPGEWFFRSGDLTFSYNNLIFANDDLLTFFGAQGKAKHSTQGFFPEDSGFLSKIWSVIWRIPWNAKFGILMEWVPLLISLGWLFIWYMIMVVIVRRAIAMGDDDPDTFFIQFTRFAQVFYLFCSIQAVF